METYTMTHLKNILLLFCNIGRLVARCVREREVECRRQQNSANTQAQ